MTPLHSPKEYLFNLYTTSSGEAKRMWRQHIKEQWNRQCAYCGSEENLTIDGPDEKGDYQLVFEVEASGEKIPLSTVAPRQRGLGYEPAVNLEMNLHPSMKEKLYCANVAEGRDFPEKEEYSKKYTC